MYVLSIQESVLPITKLKSNTNNNSHNSLVKKYLKAFSINNCWPAVLVFCFINPHRLERAQT